MFLHLSRIFIHYSMDNGHAAMQIIVGRANAGAYAERWQCLPVNSKRFYRNDYAPCWAKALCLRPANSKRFQ